MKSFLIDAGIMLCLFIPMFLFTFTVLWKVRVKGLYTVFLGFFIFVVFLCLGYAIAPQAMLYHHSVGMPPVQQGIAMGCVVPMAFMMVYHMDQRQKRKQAAKETVSKI